MNELCSTIVPFDGRNTLKDFSEVYSSILHDVACTERTKMQSLKRWTSRTENQISSHQARNSLSNLLCTDGSNAVYSKADERSARTHTHKISSYATEFEDIQNQIEQKNTKILKDYHGAEDTVKKSSKKCNITLQHVVDLTRACSQKNASFKMKKMLAKKKKKLKSADEKVNRAFNKFLKQKNCLLKRTRKLKKEWLQKNQAIVKLLLNDIIKYNKEHAKKFKEISLKNTLTELADLSSTKYITSRLQQFSSLYPRLQTFVRKPKSLQEIKEYDKQTLSATRNVHSPDCYPSIHVSGSSKTYDDKHNTLSSVIPESTRLILSNHTAAFKQLSLAGKSRQNDSSKDRNQTEKPENLPGFIDHEICSQKGIKNDCLIDLTVMKHEPMDYSLLSVSSSDLNSNNGITGTSIEKPVEHLSSLVNSGRRNSSSSHTFESVESLKPSSTPIKKLGKRLKKVLFEKIDTLQSTQRIKPRKTLNSIKRLFSPKKSKSLCVPVNNLENTLMNGVSETADKVVDNFEHIRAMFCVETRPIGGKSGSEDHLSLESYETDSELGPVQMLKDLNRSEEYRENMGHESIVASQLQGFRDKSQDDKIFQSNSLKADLKSSSVIEHPESLPVVRSSQSHLDNEGSNAFNGVKTFSVYGSTEYEEDDMFPGLICSLIGKYEETAVIEKEVLPTNKENADENPQLDSVKAGGNDLVEMNQDDQCPRKKQSVQSTDTYISVASLNNKSHPHVETNQPSPHVNIVNGTTCSLIHDDSIKIKDKSYPKKSCSSYCKTQAVDDSFDIPVTQRCNMISENDNLSISEVCTSDFEIGYNTSLTSVSSKTNSAVMTGKRQAKVNKLMSTHPAKLQGTLLKSNEMIDVEPDQMSLEHVNDILHFNSKCEHSSSSTVSEKLIDKQQKNSIEMDRMRCKPSISQIMKRKEFISDNDIKLNKSSDGLSECNTISSDSARPASKKEEIIEICNENGVNNRLKDSTNMNIFHLSLHDCNQQLSDSSHSTVSCTHKSSYLSTDVVNHGDLNCENKQFSDISNMQSYVSLMDMKQNETKIENENSKSTINRLRNPNMIKSDKMINSFVEHVHVAKKRNKKRTKNNKKRILKKKNSSKISVGQSFQKVPFRSDESEAFEETSDFNHREKISVVRKHSFRKLIGNQHKLSRYETIRFKECGKTPKKLLNNFKLPDADGRDTQQGLEESNSKTEPPTMSIKASKEIYPECLKHEDFADMCIENKKCTTMFDKNCMNGSASRTSATLHGVSTKKKNKFRKRQTDKHKYHLSGLETTMLGKLETPSREIFKDKNSNVETMTDCLTGTYDVESHSLRDSKVSKTGLNKYRVKRMIKSMTNIFLPSKSYQSYSECQKFENKHENYKFKSFSPSKTISRIKSKCKNIKHRLTKRDWKIKGGTRDKAYKPGGDSEMLSDVSFDSATIQQQYCDMLSRLDRLCDRGDNKEANSELPEKSHKYPQHVKKQHASFEKKVKIDRKLPSISWESFKKKHSAQHVGCGNIRDQYYSTIGSEVNKTEKDEIIGKNIVYPTKNMMKTSVKNEDPEKEKQNNNIKYCHPDVEPFCVENQCKHKDRCSNLKPGSENEYFGTNYRACGLCCECHKKINCEDYECEVLKNKANILCEGNDMSTCEKQCFNVDTSNDHLRSNEAPIPPQLFYQNSNLSNKSDTKSYYSTTCGKCDVCKKDSYLISGSKSLHSHDMCERSNIIKTKFSPKENSQESSLEYNTLKKLQKNNAKLLKHNKKYCSQSFKKERQTNNHVTDCRVLVSCGHLPEYIEDVEKVLLKAECQFCSHLSGDLFHNCLEPALVQCTEAGTSKLKTNLSSNDLQNTSLSSVSTGTEGHVLSKQTSGNHLSNITNEECVKRVGMLLKKHRALLNLIPSQQQSQSVAYQTRRQKQGTVKQSGKSLNTKLVDNHRVQNKTCACTKTSQTENKTVDEYDTVNVNVEQKLSKELKQEVLVDNDENSRMSYAFLTEENQETIAVQNSKLGDVKREYIMNDPKEKQIKTISVPTSPLVIGPGSCNVHCKDMSTQTEDNMAILDSNFESPNMHNCFNQQEREISSKTCSVAIETSNSATEQRNRNIEDKNANVVATKLNNDVLQSKLENFELNTQTNGNMVWPIRMQEQCTETELGCAVAHPDPVSEHCSDMKLDENKKTETSNLKFASSTTEGCLKIVTDQCKMDILIDDKQCLVEERVPSSDHIEINNDLKDVNDSECVCKQDNSVKTEHSIKHKMNPIRTKSSGKKSQPKSSALSLANLYNSHKDFHAVPTSGVKRPFSLIESRKGKRQRYLVSDSASNYSSLFSEKEKSIKTLFPIHRKYEKTFTNRNIGGWETKFSFGSETDKFSSEASVEDGGSFLNQSEISEPIYNSTPKPDYSHHRNSSFCAASVPLNTISRFSVINNKTNLPSPIKSSLQTSMLSKNKARNKIYRTSQATHHKWNDLEDSENKFGTDSCKMDNLKNTDGAVQVGSWFWMKGFKCKGKGYPSLHIDDIPFYRKNEDSQVT